MRLKAARFLTRVAVRLTAPAVCFSLLGGVAPAGAQISSTSPYVLITPSPFWIPQGGSTSVQFLVQNPTSAPISAMTLTVQFTSTDVTVVLPPNTSPWSCTSGSSTSGLTGAYQLNSISLTGHGDCVLTLIATGRTYGQKVTNATLTSSTGTTLGSNQAAFTVLQPPTIQQSFASSIISLNGNTSLRLILSNPNSSAPIPSGISFTDVLPDGLVIATPNSLTNTCNGNVTADPGSSNLSLTNGSVAQLCDVSVSVSGVSVGTKNNTVSVSSTPWGDGNTSTASISVVSFQAPKISVAFGQSVRVGNDTQLSFTISNPNTNHDLSSINFTDNLPQGLLVASPNGMVGSCGGGTVTADAGSGAIALSNASLASNASCTFSVNVVPTTSGAKTDSATVSSSDGEGNTASAVLDVLAPLVAPPTIVQPTMEPVKIVPLSVDAKFRSAIMLVNGLTNLTFTIQNSGDLPANGLGLKAKLPAGLIVALPNALINTCGGKATATSWMTTLGLMGGTLAPHASCSFSINVTATSTGEKKVSAIMDYSGGTSLTSISAIVTVQPEIQKAPAPVQPFPKAPAPAAPPKISVTSA